MRTRTAHRHCGYCQRRTGNIFQVSCWYFADQITSRTGEGQIYKARTTQGRLHVRMLPTPPGADE